MPFRILDQKAINFLTITVVDWIDLFTRPVYRDMVIDSLQFCQQNKGLIIYGYVIMSNHMHLVVQTKDDAGLSGVLQSFKSFTAKEIIKYLEDRSQPESRREWLLERFAYHARKYKNHSRYQIWKKDNHPVEVYSPHVIRQKMAYIHYNPVRARIVARPADYLYSSAGSYLGQKGLLQVTLLDDLADDLIDLNNL